MPRAAAKPVRETIVAESIVDATGEIALHLIDENPDNPRLAVDEAEDAELTASIGARGVLQAIRVRPHPTEAGRFVVIAGSRRRRCSLAAGKLTIPAVVAQADDDEAFEQATIENVQRDDMNPMDTARAFKRMIDRRMTADRKLPFKAAKEDVSRVVGKSVRLIELRLQFLDRLPPIKQAELQAGKITAKDATDWIREQPEPLTDAVALVMAEAFDAWKRAEPDHEAGIYSQEVEVRGTTKRTDKEGHTNVTSSVDEPAFAELKKRQVFERVSAIVIAGVETGRHKLAFRWFHADQEAEKLLPGIRDEKKRAAIIADLRSKVLKHAAKAIPEGEYATEWLNGPFEVAPAVAAEIAEKRAAQDARNAEVQAERDAEDQARIAANRAAHERFDRMAAAEDLLRELAAPMVAEVLALAGDCGLALPLYHDADNAGGVVVDSTGKIIVGHEWHDGQFRRPVMRLLVSVVNAAAGLATPARDPRKDEPDDLTRAEFAKTIADVLLEDAGDLGEGDLAEARALMWANSGLEAFLAGADIPYGHPDYDWQEDGAMHVAEGIRKGEIGTRPDTASDEQDTPAADAAAEGDDAPLPGFLTRLAGGPGAAPTEPQP